MTLQELINTRILNTDCDIKWITHTGRAASFENVVLLENMLARSRVMGSSIDSLTPGDGYRITITLDYEE